jgi:hypothetical protein
MLSFIHKETPWKYFVNAHIMYVIVLNVLARTTFIYSIILMNT